MLTDISQSDKTLLENGKMNEFEVSFTEIPRSRGIDVLAAESECG